MGSVINFDLLAHPANWLIIFLILYLCAMLARAVLIAAETGVTPIPFPA